MLFQFTDFDVQKVCAKNMIGMASQLGCSATDIACLCKNQDFGNGIRDCAFESCGDDAAAGKVVAWGQQYCASNGGTGGVSVPTSEHTPISMS